MTSELILYLEPSRHSALSAQTQQFYEASRLQPFSNNEALRYPIHSTMVGFFNRPISPSAPLPDGLGSLIEYLENSIPRLSQSLKSQPFQSLDGVQTKPPVLIQGYVRPSPDSLLIALLPSDELSELVLDLCQQFPSLGLRLKRINHLSLCYWDASEMIRRNAMSEKEQSQRARWVDQAYALAYEKIPMLRPLCNQEDDQSQVQQQQEQRSRYVLNESWDIVLYEILGRDKTNDLPYPLQELKRWTL
ncbi:hypothetical protein K7432_009756 [Basidiobolus ranarum]|uniref:RNA ligase/cyclic nucleotide phosphodiesterase family protein n=1 Tax=Basidiobolus ranarum TaxID=34480 RepID=A0ABR2WPS3_9FUNG